MNWVHFLEFHVFLVGTLPVVAQCVDMLSCDGVRRSKRTARHVSTAMRQTKRIVGTLRGESLRWPPSRAALSSIRCSWPSLSHPSCYSRPLKHLPLAIIMLQTKPETTQAPAIDPTTAWPRGAFSRACTHFGRPMRFRSDWLA